MNPPTFLNLDDQITGNNRSNSDQSGEKSLKFDLFQNLFQYRIKNEQWVEERANEDWQNKVFKNSANFQGYDDIIWGKFIACVYKDPTTEKISSLIIDKTGFTHFNSTDISRSSQYYPAIENLDDEGKASKVKKCIAVSLLQKYSQLTEGEIAKLRIKGNCDTYDPIHVGNLVNNCKLINFCTPENIGKYIINSGGLQHRYIRSALLDVVYQNKESLQASNNKIVRYLGKQSEQLFDSLSEYSPEQVSEIYLPPLGDEAELKKISMVNESNLVKSIFNEFLTVQTKFSSILVDFLQHFLIPLRESVLAEKITGLSMIKLNRLFPPTIDEVTRINCMLADALKNAEPYGPLELLKACSIIIPYFYRASIRHEAATKNFRKDIKVFLRNFRSVIDNPSYYTELKLETIIRGPIDKLLNLKLIVDRLWKKKEWTLHEKEEARLYYNNIIYIINSFGHLKEPIQTNKTGVFTPTGKLLTELAKGWPPELQNRWFKRRIVGLFDIELTQNTESRGLLAIFSDYIVIISIKEAEKYYSKDFRKPLISDILMNSLINEVSLPENIPKLVVNYAFPIKDAYATIYDEKVLGLEIHGEKFHSMIVKIISNSATAKTVEHLVTRAKILGKSTGFHLFKASKRDFHLYSTIHEYDAYNSELVKSKFSLFLNIEPSSSFYKLNSLQTSIFATMVDENSEKEMIKMTVISANGKTIATKVAPENFLSQLFFQLAFEIPMYHSSILSSSIENILESNEYVLRNIGRSQKKIASSNIILNQTITEASLDENTLPIKKSISYGSITTFRSYASDIKDIKYIYETTIEKIGGTNPVSNERRKSKGSQIKKKY